MLALSLLLLSGLQDSAATAPQIAAADSARATILRAAERMGGESALRNLGSVRRMLDVHISDPTQGSAPPAPGEMNPDVFVTNRQSLDIDYAGGRQRTLDTGTIHGGQPTQTLTIQRPDSILVIDFTLNTAQRFAGSGARPIVGRFWPESIVRRALANPDSLAWLGHRREAERTIAVVRFAEPGVPFLQRLLFDTTSGMMIGVEADTDSPVAGDVLTRFDFSDYRSIGGVTLAFDTVLRRDGVRAQHIEVRSAAVNASLPDSLFTIDGPFDEPPAVPSTLTAAPIGKDLYLLRGAYNSLFLVASDHVVVIEAPVNSRRSMQVIAEIHRVAPGKPIRFVVATHFHGDHIGGLRPFIAEGAVIVTTASAKQVIEENLGRPRTFNADTLSAAPRQAQFEVVGSRRMLGDASHRIEVIEVGPNPHADEILVAWFPDERLLFEGDLLDLQVAEGRPGMAGDDTKAMAEAVARLGLDVQRIIPVHGRPGTRSDLDRTLSRAMP